MATLAAQQALPSWVLLLPCIHECLPACLATTQVLPQLADVLRPADCQLLRAVGDACGHTAFAELLRRLDAALEEDVQALAKNTFLNRCG